MQASEDGPNPAAVTSRADLVNLIKQLLIVAGKPSYRQVEADTVHAGGKLPHTNLDRVPLHRTTLGQVLAGRTLPTKAFYLTLVERCGIDLDADRRWERAWDVVALAGTATPVAADQEPAPAEPEFVAAAVVSCDIVGHAAMPDAVQHRNIRAINEIVANAIGSVDPPAVWASGGDGGHVVFRHQEWRPAAIALMTRLHDWSRKSGTDLRITAHHGPVHAMTGADGRVQFVGAGINLAGRLLALGIPTGVLATADFAAAYREKPGDELRFHGGRTLIGKKMRDLPVLLASTGTIASRWPDPVTSDRDDLAEAVESGDGWAILHNAKRIMQINPEDEQAVEAVHGMFPGSLLAGGQEAARPNPLLSYLNPVVVHEILQLGELVERDRGEVICRYGDRGDSMFVVLRGRLGVLESEGRGGGTDPEIVINVGDIAGELAFALERPRSAGLVAVTDVVLLSLRAADVFKRFSSDAFGDSREALQRFVNARVLEHITYNASYLIGADQDGPLTAGHRTLRESLAALAVGSRLITLDPIDLRLTFERVSADVGTDGLYILAAGEVDGVVADEPGMFPVLWAHVPGVLGRTTSRYTLVSDPVKILHIRHTALARLEPAKRAALYAALTTMRFPEQ